MLQQQLTNKQHSPQKDRRWLWLFIAILSVSIHHVHSLFVEPDVNLFRHLAFVFLVIIMPFSLLIPSKRLMGILWTLIGIPIIYHAIAGHIMPMIFDSVILPATESVLGNLVGGAILCVTGAFTALALYPYDKRRIQNRNILS